MSSNVLAVINPATGETLDEVPISGPKEVESALKLARRGAAKWSATPVHDRVGRIRTLSSLVRDHKDRLASLLTAEVGKLLSESKDEVEACARLMEGYANQALHTPWDLLPGGVQPGLEQDLIMITREPLGIVGAILPFNFPLDLLAHKIGPALAVGNSVILKPSEDAPLAVMEVGKLARQAGIEEEVLQILPGDHTTGKALVDSEVDAISFTGSVPVGVEIATSRAKHLTPTLLELGGNDAAIVLDDADLELAIDSILSSRLLVNGQCCCATKRIISTNAITSSLTESLADRLQALNMGNPADEESDVGPLVNHQAAQRSAQQIEQAVANGASILCGTGQAEEAFLEPVLLVDVPIDSAIATDEEVFAPVFPIIRVADEAEAIRAANATPYGLNASIFSQDTARALSVARKVQAGTIAINGPGLFRVDAAPFGGFKKSGLGREGFLVSLEELTQPKTISLRGYWG